MTPPQDPVEHALVIKALTSGLSNCVEWIDTRTEDRINRDPSMLGVSAKGVRLALLAFAKNGGLVEQIPE